MVDTTRLKATALGPNGVIRDDGHSMHIGIEVDKISAIHPIHCSCGFGGFEDVGGGYKPNDVLDATHARLLNEAYEWNKQHQL